MEKNNYNKEWKGAINKEPDLNVEGVPNFEEKDSTKEYEGEHHEEWAEHTDGEPTLDPKNLEDDKD